LRRGWRRHLRNRTFHLQKLVIHQQEGKKKRRHGSEANKKRLSPRATLEDCRQRKKKGRGQITRPRKREKFKEKKKSRAALLPIGGKGRKKGREGGIRRGYPARA